MLVRLNFCTQECCEQSLRAVTYKWLRRFHAPAGSFECLLL
jgi:hypothetical protein